MGTVHADHAEPFQLKIYLFFQKRVFLGSKNIFKPNYAGGFLFALLPFLSPVVPPEADLYGLHQRMPLASGFQVG